MAIAVFFGPAQLRVPPMGGAVGAQRTWVAGARVAGHQVIGENAWQVCRRCPNIRGADLCDLRAGSGEAEGAKLGPQLGCRYPADEESFLGGRLARDEFDLRLA